MHRHETTFLGPNDIGRVARPYLPTFDFQAEFIDAGHSHIGSLPLLDHLLVQLPNANTGNPVPGWLQRADALKLYEMAYFSDGDVLELGCYHGLSTIIMAMGVQRAARGIRVETVDLEPVCVSHAAANVAANGLADFVTATPEDAVAAIRRFAAASREFGFAFVDHSHAYDAVKAVCGELSRVLKVGGFVLFHDFNDPRNQDPSDTDYGVYQAVLDGLPSDSYQFFGIYGCTALYRRAA